MAYDIVRMVVNNSYSLFAGSVEPPNESHRTTLQSLLHLFFAILAIDGLHLLSSRRSGVVGKTHVLSLLLVPYPQRSGKTASLNMQTNLLY